MKNQFKTVLSVQGLISLIILLVTFVQQLVTQNKLVLHLPHSIMLIILILSVVAMNFER